MKIKGFCMIWTVAVVTVLVLFEQFLKAILYTVSLRRFRDDEIWDESIEEPTDLSLYTL